MADLFHRTRALALTVGWVVGGLLAAQAENASPVLIAYAREVQFEMLVGQYDPSAQRWMDHTRSFVPPPVGTPFTLFGASGKRADVHIHTSYRTPLDDQPWHWSVAISSWDRTSTHVALGLSDEWPDLPRPAQRLPLSDAEAVAAISQFLKEHKLDVSAPRVTEVLRVDINGDGQEETIVCANSDNASLKDDVPAAVYSLAILLAHEKGPARVLPLRTAMSYKPAHQSVDEHQRLHGRFAFYQVLALTDAARDGHEQIAILNDNRYEGPEIDLYALRDAKVVHLISTRKLFQ